MNRGQNFRCVTKGATGCQNKNKLSQENRRFFKLSSMPFCNQLKSIFRSKRFDDGNLSTENQLTKSVAKCRGSWVVGRGRGPWVWVVGTKIN